MEMMVSRATRHLKGFHIPIGAGLPSGTHGVELESGDWKEGLVGSMNLKRLGFNKSSVKGGTYYHLKLS